MYLSKLLKAKIYFLIISTLTLMSALNAKAELITPNNEIKPYQVIKIQLTSLMKNDQPNQDSGIKQTWEFAHPNNQKNTGPISKFTKMLKGKSYEMLLDHLEHKIVEVKSNDLTVLFEVTVLDPSKVYYKFNWQVEKYSEEGPLKDCWLTTIVSVPISLGSSI
jgi:hypothetical protein